MEEQVPESTELPELIKLINTADPEQVLKGTSGVRKLLLYERCTPSQVLETGVLPRLITFLEESSPSDLQFETCWIISIYAFLQLIKVLVDVGSLLPLVKLLSTKTTDQVKDKAIFGLGNLIKVSDYCRKMVLDLDVMQPLIKLAEETTDQQLLRNISWVVALLGRGPYPPLQMTLPSLGILHKFLFNENPDIQLEGIRGISYIAARPEGIQSVIESGSVKRVIEIMNHSETSMFIALTMIASLGMGQESQVNYIIELGGLNITLEMFDHPSDRIRAHGFVAIGNLLRPSTIQKSIDLGFFTRFITLANSETKDFNSLCEVVIVFTNAVRVSTVEQIEYFVSIGLMPAFSRLVGLEMKYGGCDIPNFVIQTWLLIFKAGETLKDKHNGENPFVLAFKEAKGVASLGFVLSGSRDPTRITLGNTIYQTYLPEMLKKPITPTTATTTTQTQPSSTSSSNTPNASNTAETAKPTVAQPNTGQPDGAKNCIIN